MLSPWVIEEVKDVDLQDKRLNDRLAVILDLLSGHSTASIPAACGGYAEMMAAYRFFNNEKVDFENVLQPHVEATARRMWESFERKHGRVTTNHRFQSRSGKPIAGTFPLKKKKVCVGSTPFAIHPSDLARDGANGCSTGWLHKLQADR